MDRNIDIFKHLVFRFASLPFSNLEKNFPSYIALKAAILKKTEIQKTYEFYKCELCEELECVIKCVSSDSDRKKLINFKRDIYNERIREEKNFIEISHLLPNRSLELYSTYISVKASINALYSSINSAYINAYQEDIELVRSLCKSEQLKSGLLLSSKYLFEVAANHVKEVRDEKSLLGLWKYITRTITKPTPFSTFTHINIATLQEKCNPTIQVTEYSKDIISAVRYNNFILDNLLLHIQNHPDFFELLSLTLNSTVRVDQDNISFFTNNNNIESIQNIKSTPIIEFIVSKLQDTKSVELGGFVKELLMLLDNRYEYSQVIQYIFELVQTGLLLVDIKLSGLDTEWDNSLANFVSEHLSSFLIGKGIYSHLIKLIEFKKTYSQSLAEKRKVILEDIHCSFEKIFELVQDVEENTRYANVYNYNHITNEEKSLSNVFLHRLPAKQKILDINNLIYEDTSRSISISCDQIKVRALIQKLDAIMSTFSNLCVQNLDQERLYYFYQDIYKDREEVRLLDFYQNLYKHNPVVQPKNNQELTQRITQFIHKATQKGFLRFEGHHCAISTIFLEEYRKELMNTMPISKPKNNAAFIQLFLDREIGLKGVVSSGILPGRGKLMGRFLHLFPKEVTDDIIAWNDEGINGDEIFIENSDASFFNANLHPRLLNYEIHMPGGHLRSDENLVNVLDLIVKPDHPNKELNLFYNGKKAFVYDLGFETLMRRSNLYKLLCAFGHNVGYPYQMICQVFNACFAQIKKVGDYSIIINPRIDFDESLILQRKHWIIPIHAIPESIRKKKLADEELFIAIINWKNELGIPDIGFTKVFYNNNNGGKPMGRDDYKPQFTNFLSPLSIRLFLKSISKISTGSITIEEMLPSPETLINIGEEKFCSESLIHWKSC